MESYSIPKYQLPQYNVESFKTPQFSIEKNKLPKVTTELVKQNNYYNTYKPKQYATEEKKDAIDRYSKYTDANSLYSDSKDPTQVNSIVDVWSKAAYLTKQSGQTGTLAALAFVKNLGWNGSGAFDEYLHRTVLDPINAGNLGALAANNLVAFGETVDTLANVVKSLYPKSWTTAKYDTTGNSDTIGKRLNRTFKWDNGGRYSYDMELDFDGKDSGFNIFETIANLGMEMLSDPINWLTWGTSAIAKNIGKEGLSEAVEKFGKEYGDDIAISLTKKESKTWLKKYFQATATENTKDIYQFELDFSNMLINKLGVAINAKNPLFKTMKDPHIARVIFEGVEESITNKTTYNILRSVYAVADKTNTALNIAGAPLVFGGANLVKHFPEFLHKFIPSRINEVYKDAATLDCGLALHSLVAKEYETKKILDDLAQYSKVSPDDVKKLIKENVESTVVTQTQHIIGILGDPTINSDPNTLVDTLTKEISRITCGECATIEEYSKYYFELLDNPDPLLERIYNRNDLRATMEGLVKYEKALKESQELYNLSNTATNLTKRVDEFRAIQFYDSEKTLDDILTDYESGTLLKPVYNFSESIDNYFAYLPEDPVLIKTAIRNLFESKADANDFTKYLKNIGILNKYGEIHKLVKYNVYGVAELVMPELKWSELFSDWIIKTKRLPNIVYTMPLEKYMSKAFSDISDETIDKSTFAIINYFRNRVFSESFIKHELKYKYPNYLSLDSVIDFAINISKNMDTLKDYCMDLFDPNSARNVCYSILSNTRFYNNIDVTITANYFIENINTWLNNINLRLDELLQPGILIDDPNIYLGPVVEIASNLRNIHATISQIADELDSMFREAEGVLSSTKLIESVFKENDIAFTELFQAICKSELVTGASRDVITIETVDSIKKDSIDSIKGLIELLDPNKKLNVPIDKDGDGVLRIEAYVNDLLKDAKSFGEVSAALERMDNEVITPLIERAQKEFEYVPTKFELEVLGTKNQKGNISSLLNKKLNEYREAIFNHIKDSKRISAGDEPVIALRIENSRRMINMCFGPYASGLYRVCAPGGYVDTLMNTYENSNKEIYSLLSTLKERVSIMETQRDMIILAAKFIPDGNVFTSVMESLTNYLKLSPDMFISERTMDSLIDTIKVNLNYREYLRCLKLDEFRNKFNDPEYVAVAKRLFGENKAQAYIDKATKYGHVDPDSDLIATMLVAAKEDPKGFNNFIKASSKNNDGVVIDIETGMKRLYGAGYFPASNRYITPINQIDIRNPLTGKHTLLRLQDVTDAPDNISNVILFKDEEGLLKYFDNVLKNNKIRFLSGYNCVEFDFPYIYKRMELNNLKNTYFYKTYSEDRFHIYDPLLNIRKAQKQTNLTKDMIENIKDFCYIYARNMYDHEFEYMQEIKPYKIKEIFYDIVTNYDTYIDPKDVNYEEFRTFAANYLTGFDNYESKISNKMFDGLLMTDISKGNDKFDRLYEALRKVEGTKYYGMDKETFINTVKEEIGRDDFTTMQQLWMNTDESSRIMFQYVYYGNGVKSGDRWSKPSRYLDAPELKASELLRVPRRVKAVNNTVYDVLEDGTEKRLTDTFEEISLYEAKVRTNNDKAMINLFNNRIKNIEGIYRLETINKDGTHSLLFKDANDLFKKTTELVENAREDSWLYTINLHSPFFDTEAGRFALWYRNFVYETGKTIGQSTAIRPDKDFKDVVDTYILQQVNKRVFANNALDKFADTIIQNTPAAMITQPGYDALDGISRVIGYNSTLSALPNADARSYVTTAMKQKVTNFVNWFYGKSMETQQTIYDKFQNYQDIVLKKHTYTSLKNAINNPEEFVSELCSTGGSRRFSADLDKLVNNATRREFEIYSGTLDELLSRADELDKYGIKVIKTSSKAGDTVYEFVLDFNKGFNYDSTTGLYKFNGKTYKEFKLEPPSCLELDDENIEGFTEHLLMFDEINKYSYDTLGYSGVGWALVANNVDQLYYSDLSDAAKKYAITPQMLEDAGWFHKKRFFTADTTPRAFRNNLISNPGNPLTNMFKAYNRALYATEAKDLFMDYLCNVETSMTFAKDGFFKGLSDLEILDIFKNTDDLIVIAPIKANNNQGYLLKRIPIYSIKDINVARESNAVIVNYQLYSTMFDEINNNRDAILKNSPYILRMVNYIYKIGYLMSPGTWMRNIFDSNLKAVLDTEDPIGMVRNTVKADRLYRQYDNTLKLMSTDFDLANHNFNVTYIKKFFNDESIQTMLKKNNKYIDNFKDFMDIDNFINFGPSAGYSNSVKKLLGQEENNILFNIGSKMLTPMSYIESRVRLAEYFTLKDQGYVNSKLFQKVSDTAFDYGIKTTTDKFIEQFIPFFNFQKLNFLYWIDKMCYNPIATKLVFEMDKTAEESFDFTPEEYQTNQSLRYSLDNGAINLGANATLKMNPSYLDAYNLLCDPVSGILQSTWAPLKPAFKEMKEIIPSLFASGLNLKGADAGAHFKKICEAIFEDPNSYPWYGVFYQRYFAKDDPNTLNDEDSTARKNYKRIEDDMFKKLGAAFPDIFGSVNRWNNYKWNEGLPDRNTDPEKYYSELKRRAATKEFQDMYARMKSNPNPSDKQQKFLSWIESTYFPYASKKQKDFFESGRYKQYASGVRKSLYSSNYQYNKDKYPSRNRNYYRDVPKFKNSTFWKVYNQAKAHAYYGWSVRIGSQYLNFNYFSSRY